MQIGNDSCVFEYPITCIQKISKFTLILLKLMYTFVFYVLPT